MTKWRSDFLTAVCTICLTLASSAVGAAPADPSDQARAAREAYRREWTELTRTEALRPRPFVPGRIRPIVRAAVPAVHGTVFGYYAGEGVEGIDFRLLSHLGLAFVQVLADGNIIPLPLSDFPPWTEAVNAAHREGVKVVLVAANVDEDGFRPDVAAAILASKGRRDRLITLLVNEVKRNELDGVSVDFEEVLGAYRDEFTSFVADLATALRRENPEYHVSVATPTYDWAGFFDYPALANVADALLTMQYGYHFEGSGVAGPQAPLERDGDKKNVLDSLTTRYLAAGVPAEKLVLLMPYYGYLWNVRADADPRVAGAAVTGVRRKVHIDEAGLPNLTYDETIDLRGQSFHYRTSGGWQQGWVDDAASIGKKCDLARELDLQGVGIWRLEYGKDYPELWDEITRRFATTCPTGDLSIPRDRWRLEAWNNQTLSGPKAEVRYDAPGTNGFEFYWGSGPPSDCLGQENFSVRFWRVAYFPESTTYSFATVADDGVRLVVDGAVIIDRWEDGSGARSAAASAFVAQGWHSLRLDYYQARGDAMVRLSWYPLSPCHDDVPAGSWRGEYYANPTLSGLPAMVRDEGAQLLAHDWGAGSPGPSCGLPADGFSARWTRTVTLGEGTYHFIAGGDGGFRLHVDGSPVLDAWHSRAASHLSVDLALEHGPHVITFDYRDDGGDAAAGMSWALAGATATTLLAPVAAGQTLTVTHGYNNPLPGETCVIGKGPDHCENQKYGLDLTTDGPTDTRILAPLPGTVDWVSGDCLGLRTADDLNLNICHFGGFGVRPGDSVARGAVLGARSTSWIHLSLDDRHRNPVRPFPPVPFNGAHTIEGMAFDPLGDGRRNQHLGRTILSTNLPSDVEADADCARLMGDIGYEDGSPVDPGETIRRAWLLNNCGTATWGLGTRAVRIAGAFGPGSFTIPVVPPGTTGALWATIIVPTTAGTHEATYRLVGPRGSFGDRFSVEVTVRGPVPTPLPSPTPPPTPTPGADCATFVRHVNWVDGSVVAPGATITKRWELRNCGGTVWDLSDGYKAVRISGGYGPSEFRIPVAAPGQVVEAAADIVVPSSPGTHRATYRLTGPAGNFGDEFRVEVVVSSPTTASPTPVPTAPPTATPSPTRTPTPSPTPTPAPPPTAAPTPSATATPSPVPTPTRGTDCAAFVRHVTYPDGTTVAAGATITKVWELRNCGGTVWDLSDGYKAVRISGGYGPSEFRIPVAAPGQVVEAAADIVVPTSPGTHRATYRLTGPAGNFGDEFRVEVVVSSPTATPSPTPVPTAPPTATPSPTPVPTAPPTATPKPPPTNTPTPTPTSAPTNDCAAFVRDVNYPDGTMVVAGTEITKRWELRNCGNTTWSSGYKAVRIGGSYGPSEFSVPAASPGQVVVVLTRLRVPTTSGLQRATYRLRGPRGTFGDQFWIEVLVVPGPVS